MRQSFFRALRFSLISMTMLAAGQCSGTKPGSPGTSKGAEAGAEGGSKGGAEGGTCAPGASGPLGFTPSNVPAGAISDPMSSPQDEVVAASCTIDTTQLDDDCFHSPMVVVHQMADNSEVALFVVQSLSVTGANTTIVAQGALPVIIVSLTDVSIEGRIDAHSASLQLGAGGYPGPDGYVAGSGKGGGPAASGSGAAMGGGGGSNCGGGGIGGGVVVAAGANPYYPSVGAANLQPLHGGSAGGGGIVGGGSGGGAIQIVAKNQITLHSTAIINVGGEGGGPVGDTKYQNGGGGGAGGAILLEAPSVILQGSLLANGGGGGGPGASGDDSGTSNLGQTTAASGGGSLPYGGGSGAAGTKINGAYGGSVNDQNSLTEAWGSGGGGGAGYIRVNSCTSSVFASATLSPLPTTSCTTSSSLE